MGGFVVSATNAGFPVHPGWYHNLTANPQVGLEFPGGKRVRAWAEVTPPELRHDLWSHLIELAPGYAAYERRTQRQIPMIVLHPEPTP
jgi:deazaflavin-dependent oxidoreductase (nitroreductase family)